MAGSLQARIKTWVSAEDVTYSDLNAEFDNVLAAMRPSLIDDYSANVAEMQVTADPGEVGTESLATTLAGELARIRFALREITGEDKWYETPISSLAGLANAVGTGLNENRLVSGLVVSGSHQPGFLIANGAAKTVKCDGTPTTFIYYVDGTEYSITTDVTLTGLTAAPSSNNTCLIDDAIATADPDWSKYTGENGSSIAVDTMGTEISGLIGKFAAFKLAGSTDEYFIAYVASATSLTKAKRGYFFDSTNVAVPRAAYTNNDTITLMKLTWVFAKSDGTLTATYNNPVWSDDEPSSPAIGDYWFDYSANTWKVYGVGSYAVANAVLIGCCIQDATNTVAARSFEFFKNYTDQNTVELIFDTNAIAKARFPGSVINVWGETIKNEHNLHSWDMTIDRDSGVSESASTYYYFYLTETGDKVISDIKPHDRTADLGGHYHTHKSWRCVGWAFNNASSNLTEVESYYHARESDAIRSVIATDVLQTRDRVIVLSGASFTEYLPPAALSKGNIYKFIHAGTTISQVYTLDGFASETIGGAATFALYTNGESLYLVSDGTNWQILSRRTDTGWIAYTPTIVGLGTPSAVSFFYRRIGDSVYVRGFLTSGTTTAVKASISLPSGLSMDTSKTAVSSTNANPGEQIGNYVSNTSGGFGSLVTATATDATLIYLGGAGAGTVGCTPANGSAVIGNSVAASFTTWAIPITGWQP